MKIVVCMKQVPASSKVDIDQNTGNLKRQGNNTRTNPYDLYALECALRIKEELGGTVTVLSMGPDSAKVMIKDAFAMGADRGMILSDRKFAGADVLATSYTLVQGIRMLEGADIILCGRQTTDGDTAQIGPAIAEHMKIPHCAWVQDILEMNPESITVLQKFGQVSQVSRMHLPCLITVDSNACVPRLPSYKKRLQTMDREVEIVDLSKLADQNEKHYGSSGSRTRVERIFPPELRGRNISIEGDAKKKAETLASLLRDQKLLP